MKKLTDDQVLALRECKHVLNGDMLFWDKMAEFYADDPEVLERIAFEKKYLECLNAIPYSYNAYWKTRQTYFDTVDAFNAMVGYTGSTEHKKEFEDCLLEQIAATFGLDIDINGDGVTSFEKYRKKNNGDP